MVNSYEIINKLKLKITLLNTLVMDNICILIYIILPS